MRVLFLPGGDGDASTFDGVLAHLPRVDAVVHDRRRAGDLPLAAHTDEVAAMLTGGPATVVATSMGALIGLDLLARYPDRVGLLVAHEPPAVDLLPPAECADAVARQEAVVATYATHGADAGMRTLLADIGVDLTDREPDAALPKLTAARLRNLDHLLRYDVTAAGRHRLDAAALAPVAERIVAAGGERSGEAYPHRCALALAERFDLPFVLFPGGHTGYATHPRAFAETLLEVLLQA